VTHCKSSLFGDAWTVWAFSLADIAQNFGRVFETDFDSDQMTSGSIAIRMPTSFALVLSASLRSLVVDHQH
jgi:hypothetical protein